MYFSFPFPWLAFFKLYVILVLCLLLTLPVSCLFPSLTLTLCPLSLSFSGWVPAVELVRLVAGVTAWLSGVACDQGGCRAARTIEAERLRLTAGHLSWAISVGAEACLLLVGPAYCEDQRQSVSTLHSALSRPLLSNLCLRPSLALPPVSLCCLSISVSFPLMCFCCSLANGCCLAICYPTAQLSLHDTLFDFLTISVQLKSYNTLKATQSNPVLLCLPSAFISLINLRQTEQECIFHFCCPENFQDISGQPTLEFYHR